MNEKEKGEASIFVSLEDGVITITHGTDKVTLKKWTARSGDWDRIWETFNKLEKGGQLWK